MHDSGQEVFIYLARRLAEMVTAWTARGTASARGDESHVAFRTLPEFLLSRLQTVIRIAPYLVYGKNQGEGEHNVKVCQEKELFIHK